MDAEGTNIPVTDFKRLHDVLDERVNEDVGIDSDHE